MIILSSKSNGNCIKDSPRTIAAGRAKPLGLALEAQAAIAPHKQFINCRPARDLVKAGPDGQFVQACSNRKDQSLRSSSRRLDPLLRRVSSLSTAGFDRAPMASSQEGQTLDRAFGGRPAIAPHKQFINPPPPTDVIEAGPDASLSRPAPTGEANP